MSQRNARYMYRYVRRVRRVIMNARTCFFSPDAFFAPTAFTGQQLTAGLSTPSRTTTGVTMKIFDWKRRESEDGLGEREERGVSKLLSLMCELVEPLTASCDIALFSRGNESFHPIVHLGTMVGSVHTFVILFTYIRKKKAVVTAVFYWFYFGGT